MNSQNEPYIACKGQIIEESSVEDKQERIDIMEMVVYLSGETTMVFCELELFSRFCPVSQCAWYSVMC